MYTKHPPGMVHRVEFIGSFLSCAVLVACAGLLGRGLHRIARPRGSVQVQSCAALQPYTEKTTCPRFAASFHTFDVIGTNTSGSPTPESTVVAGAVMDDDFLGLFQFGAYVNTIIAS